MTSILTKKIWKKCWDIRMFKLRATTGHAARLLKYFSWQQILAKNRFGFSCVFQKSLRVFIFISFRWSDKLPNSDGYIDFEKTSRSNLFFMKSFYEKSGKRKNFYDSYIKVSVSLTNFHDKNLSLQVTDSGYISVVWNKFCSIFENISEKCQRR